MLNRLFIDFLPDSAKELLEVINLDSLKLLIAEYGGTRLVIPKSLNDDHVLVHLLGKEEAERLCQAFKHEFLMMPRCFKAMSVMRDAEMLKTRRSGLRLKDIAKQYGVTEMTVSLALRRADKIELSYRCKNAKTA